VGGREIVPVRILPLDQANLLLTRPTLQLFFTCDRLLRVRIFLDVYKPSLTEVTSARKYFYGP
jgi:hypothetical protein